VKRAPANTLVDGTRVAGVAGERIYVTQPSKRKPGRPKKSNAVCERVSTRVTEGVARKLRRTAKELGITVSEHVRQLIEDHA
jgi:hypothetical protein